jgi:PPOX class probable F420-dependent enzyme
VPSMDEDEARGRFAAARVARLATADAGGRPHLVPVTFAVGGDLVVTAVDHKPKRTTRLRRLANIVANSSVSLLADHYDEDWQQLWWVRADGDARITGPGAPREAPGDAELHDRAVTLLTEKYPQYRERPPDGPVIAVRVTTWTAWRAQAL